jgi:hypothetical protein
VLGVRRFVNGACLRPAAAPAPERIGRMRNCRSSGYPRIDCQASSTIGNDSLAEGTGERISPKSASGLTGWCHRPRNAEPPALTKTFAGGAP